MRLLPTKINAPLLLDGCYFKDASSDIDHLVAQACTELDVSKQLALLSHAAKECDKFHSYFHFEESFFYFTLGVQLDRLGMHDDAIESYKKSVALYPLNRCAYAALIKLCKRRSLLQGMEALLADMRSRGVVLSSTDKCVRPFHRFEDYVAFATNNRMLNKQSLETKVTANNFWLSFAEFEVSGDVNLLKETIAHTNACHESYHKNAALIYYNYAIAYERTGDTILANNMMTKAKSLDSSLTNF